MIQINLSNKTAYTLILILAILSVSLVVYAVTPANPGHSSEQVNILINGEEKTLQSAIDSGDFLLDLPATPLCVLCDSCGDLWPIETGSIDGSNGYDKAYGSSCSGDLIDRSMDRVSLCCQQLS